MLSRRWFLSLAGMLGAAALAGCAPASEKAGELSTTLFCFDTVCTLRGVMPQEALDGAAALCDRFEQLFSRTIETSDVARINAAGGEPVEVAEETAELIAKALGYCEASDGRFDITIGAVSQLWDFHGRHDRAVARPEGGNRPGRHREGMDRGRPHRVLRRGGRRERLR